MHRFPSPPPFPACFRLLLLSLAGLLFVFAAWSSDSRLVFYNRLLNLSQASTRFRPPAFYNHSMRATPGFYVQSTKATTNASPTEAHDTEPTTEKTVTTASTTNTPSQTPPTVPQTPPPPSQTPPPRYHQAYAPNYNFTLDHPDACSAAPFLVLMVPVAPKNVAAREAIRQTWGREGEVRGERVLTLFMLGRAESDPEALEREDHLHGDLLQSDFIDSYLNLTIKTMVIMHWLSTRCSRATFAMKVDSDMFLNIDNLVDMLKLPQVPRQNYLTGLLMWNRPVIRNKASKWYVPEEMYPEPNYPTYALGAGYVFSCDLPGRLVEVSKAIRPFNIEDAYVGMCMKKLGLSLTAPPSPSQFQAYNSKYDRCQFSRVITFILGSSQQLLQYWNDLKKPEPPCRRKREAPTLRNSKRREAHSLKNKERREAHSLKNKERRVAHSLKNKERRVAHALGNKERAKGTVRNKSRRDRTRAKRVVRAQVLRARSLRRSSGQVNRQRH